MISPDNNLMIWQPKEPIIGPYILILTNRINKQEKEFTCSDLFADEINLYWDEQLSLIGEYKRIGIRPYIDFGRWSPDSEYFWGFIYLVSSADPSVPEAGSVFKINARNWEIESFPIPRPGKLMNFLSIDSLNLEKEIILFEQHINEEISLYLYNLRSKEEEVIISYDKTILDKYFDGKFWRYTISGSVLSPDEPRLLEPKWVDNDTILYFDIETREEMMVEIGN